VVAWSGKNKREGGFTCGSRQHEGGVEVASGGPWSHRAREGRMTTRGKRKKNEGVRASGGGKSESRPS
jgi:hypothetical protein